MTAFIGLREYTKEALYALNAYFFPRHFPLDEGEVVRGMTEDEVCAKKVAALERAKNAMTAALSYKMDAEEAGRVMDTLMSRFPLIFDVLQKDLQAAYEGDPAAKDIDEVLLCYPGFRAVSAFRIAHELYLLNVPLIPRMLTEIAHSATGIDIHPGATVGPYFFIDHGTGVVIGETTVIGEHVKLYQHVTLGAKSFEVNPDGSLVKGIKRHPNIGDHVVIYAGATILGGDTTVGDRAVVGGNVWLTHSIPAGETVTIRMQEEGPV
ncbi:MAG: serine acetyltransferase [Lachnospiraceae bacterium]|nr:serine acetyltransferase [Lachnospiraceae bacterium]